MVQQTCASTFKKMVQQTCASFQELKKVKYTRVKILFKSAYKLMFVVFKLQYVNVQR